MGNADLSSKGLSGEFVPDRLFVEFLARLGPGDLAPGLGAGVARRSELLERLTARAHMPSRYERSGEIGRGGVGVVVRAKDLELGRDVAMKVLSSSDPPPEQVERFLDEARVTGQLDHPGIVSVHELGLDDDGRPYFTMQLVRGHDLATLLTSPKTSREWSTARALQLVVRVCEAVAFAHDRGVLHRDLKPSNIMVGSFGEVYVMDWGLAKPLSGSTVARRAETGSETSASVESTLGDPAFTRVGTVLGTPDFMSPEQARGEVDRLDARSDVYSLGAILYFVVARHSPYGRASQDPFEVVEAVKSGPPETLQQVAPDTAPELLSICAKAMAREPTARYADAMDLGTDLRAYLEGRVVAAHRVGAFAELVKWIQRNRAIATISLALLVAVVLGFAVSSVLYVQARARARELQLSAVDMHALCLRDLDAREAGLWPPGPQIVAGLEDWVRSARELERAVPALVESLREFAVGSPRLTQAEALRAEVARLCDSERGVLAADVAPHGLSIMTRLDLARDLERRSLRAPSAVALWDETERLLAQPDESRLYGGLTLRPQLGLLPLGRDPASGLLEFADLMTGDAPSRDPATGALRFEVGSALVFVLVPGGVARLGSSDSPTDARYVPGIAPSMLAGESPQIDVKLEPYFLSKYEVTQDQWRRWTGDAPSLNQPGQRFNGVEITTLHPVEQVSWSRAVEVLARFALRLPTEAQWEFAARAGTDTPWWTGPDPSSLLGKVNLADASARRAEIPVMETPEWSTYDDGWPVHAPVTAGSPNQFGFVHVLGNVIEWCEDPRADYAKPARGDFGVAIAVSSQRVQRGGSFTNDSVYSRCGYRNSQEPSYSDSVIGLRPMRPIEP